MQIKKRPSMLRTAELVDACAGSWIGSMKRRSIRGFLMIAVIFLRWLLVGSADSFSEHFSSGNLQP